MATIAQQPRKATSFAVRINGQRWLTRLLIHVPLLLCAVTMIFPLLWLVSTSLKHPGKQFVFPPQLIPNPLYWQNYVDLFRLAPMGLFLYNSAEISVLSVVGVCLSSSLAAFAFARMRFRGKETLFAILLATIM